MELREELRIQAEGHGWRIDKLTEELEAKEEEIEKLRGDCAGVAKNSRAIKSITTLVRSADASDFLGVLTILPRAQVLNDLSSQLKCPMCSKLLQVPYR